MALLMWNEGYSVGNPMLDADHRILVDLVNQLHDATETGQSRVVVGSVVNVLVEYTEHHFRREEAMLLAAAYPDFESHRTAHIALEQRLAALRDRWASGEHQVLDQEVLDFMKKWLTDHIMGADKSYGPWIEKSAGHGSPAVTVTSSRL